MVVVGLGLDASDVGAVLELGKAKTTDVFVLDGAFNVFGVFLCAEVEEGLHVKKPVDAILDGKRRIIVDVSTAD